MKTRAFEEDNEVVIYLLLHMDMLVHPTKGVFFYRHSRVNSKYIKIS